MTDIVELNRRLYFALERIDITLRHINPKCEVLFDLTLKKAEIMKDRHVINRYDFSQVKTPGEWRQIEYGLFDYLGELIIQLVKERTEKDYSEDIPF